MEWKYYEKHEGIIDYARQVDTVGNIIQSHGAVEPKACQKCKRKFETTIEERPVTAKVPTYSCDCGFKNASGDSAFEHYMLNKDHIVRKVQTERIVKMDNAVVGIIPNIQRVTDDVIILCDDCLDK